MANGQRLHRNRQYDDDATYVKKPTLRLSINGGLIAHFNDFIHTYNNSNRYF
jgi:hypothetical protein